MVSRNVKFSVESIMVTLLLILFAASMCIIIYQGSVTYKSIITNKDHEENSRIALSYINMRIKQNDIGGHIQIKEAFFEGKDVLWIRHHGEEEGFMSYIYCYDGKLWECYTDAELEHDYSTPIIDAENITFSMNDRGQIETFIDYRYQNEVYQLVQYNTLRSK